VFLLRGLGIPVALVLAIPVFLPPSNAAVRSSWLLDPAELHVSAHAKKFTCAKCHEDIVKAPLHPDPRKTKAPVSDSARAEKCRQCHVPVYQNLKVNRHGQMQNINPARFQSCLSCHDPHANVRAQYYRTGRVDLQKSLRGQCGACHQPRKALPKRPAAEEKCLGCHLVDVDDAGAPAQISKLCFDCHGDQGTETQRISAKLSPAIDEAAYRRTTHAKQACIACHTDAAAYWHAGQARVDCGRCHSDAPAAAGPALAALGPIQGGSAPAESAPPRFGRAPGEYGAPRARGAPAAPHYAKFPDSPHIAVECRACHAGGGRVVQDAVSKQVVWESTAKPGAVSGVHAIAKATRKQDCQRCHVPGNRVGAAAMVLPGKGVLCMPCHTATPTATDATTIGGLGVFLFGVAAAFSVWLTGRLPGREGAGPVARFLAVLGAAARALPSRRAMAALRALVLDGIFQRRLWKQSPGRWAIHSAILLPFVFRFAWGIAGLVAANVWRRSTWYEFLLNSNDPATALLFDLTGILVVTGAVAAMARGIAKRRERLPGLPRQDHAALGLIGGVVIVGFVLEGMRIAMTGVTWGASGAFIGYPISRLFAGWRALAGVYGYAWYLHAILTAAFAAYLPFSRMFHILVAPVWLALRGAKRAGHESKQPVPAGAEVEF
jgi:nitrate reductase gamma subunit